MDLSFLRSQVHPSWMILPNSKTWHRAVSFKASQAFGGLAKWSLASGKAPTAFASSPLLKIGANPEIRSYLGVC